MYNVKDLWDRRDMRGLTGESGLTWKKQEISKAYRSPSGRAWLVAKTEDRRLFHSSYVWRAGGPGVKPWLSSSRIN